MDLLDRLHQRLREAADAHPDADGTSEITVAHLYQQLIPYRSVRGELGVWELAAYEHALLRLLAGERGYLRVEDESVRKELQRELSAPNPILGIYRDYPDAAVTLIAAAGADGEGSAPAPPPPPALPELPRISEQEISTAPSCHRCAQPLPGVADLRFCPSCGTDQHEVPCVSCGTPLRPEWNFCIRCGRRRADRPAPS